MAEFLSQDEIDTLLDIAEEGELEMNKEVSITLAQLKELKSGRSKYVLLDNGLKLVLKKEV